MPSATRTTRLQRIAALTAAVFWGFFFFGLIDLLGFLQGAEFHPTVVLSTGWGLLFVFLVAVPLCATVFGRGDSTKSVAAELVAVALALAAAAGLAQSARHLLPAVGIAATAALIATRNAERRPLLLTRWRLSWPSMAMAALAIGPCVYYAWTSARTTGTSAITDDTWGLDHWPVQAALPLAALLVAGIAAGHPSGWRVPMWTVVAATGWFAVVALAEPDLTASVGRVWAGAMLVWALAFAVVVYRTSDLAERGTARPSTM